jgi:hypothetical protein
MGFYDDGLYDEDGYPVEPADARWHDQLYDRWGDPIDPDDEVLPSGYTRRQYKCYGASDDAIEYWGLDQPDAPPPGAAGWAAWAMSDELGEADGCGLALVVLFWALAGGAALLAALGRWVG